MTTADLLRNEGRTQGRNEGRSEGRTEGRNETLIELLEQRFGPLADDQIERVRSASGKQITVQQILAATTVEEALR